MNGSYFCDTYALFEIIRNNPNYVKYANAVLQTSLFNLVELYYGLLADLDAEKAQMIYLKFKDTVVEVTDETIWSAMAFRHAHKKKKYSYVDAIGYICAKTMGITFLTGDKGFIGMPNVEFAK